MSVARRVELLHAVADEINRRFDDFLAAEMADTGKPHALASHVDIPRGAANFKVFADIVKNVPTESFEMATPDGGQALNYAVRSPLGVIGVVCPWNLPLLLMTWKVGPALACGNTVVVKPSEETPATATLLGEVMNAVGIPPGVYNVVHGFGPDSAGEFLTRHPGVNGITFTGETRTGEAIMAAAARGVRPVSSSSAARTPASCSPMPTSTRPWPASRARPSRTAARSAWAPSGSMCSGRSSTGSSRRSRPRPRR
jgi:aminomuconate-semialdehyde/2-hydroxymuconate-6-semialdehyde dehydrogenase